MQALGQFSAASLSAVAEFEVESGDLNRHPNGMALLQAVTIIIYCATTLALFVRT